MPDNNTTPDTAEAKINLLFDSYADGDISADEAKQQLKELLVDAQTDLLKHCYVDQGEIYVRFQGGFAEQYERIKQLQQTRQEEE